MAISLTLDPQDGVWTLQQRTSLLDGRSFRKWREHLLDALKEIDHPIDLLVDLEGLSLHPSVVPAFAFVLCRTPWIREALYYGADRSMMATLKFAHPYVRLHPDRASALARLEDLRCGRPMLRRSGTVLAPSAVNQLLAANVNERKRR
ncbi:MAG TPA: hypothetical protein VLM85_06710 [Polyangiaceae bacterium]|nr:hypothetical protein [Polyangiaceae bacterium]